MLTIEITGSAVEVRIPDETVRFGDRGVMLDLDPDFAAWLISRFWLVGRYGIPAQNITRHTDFETWDLTFQPTTDGMIVAAANRHDQAAQADIFFGVVECADIIYALMRYAATS